MRLIAILALALALGACKTAGSVCDGWGRLTPNASTRSHIVANDEPFARQVAGHNRYGSSRSCW